MKIILLFICLSLFGCKSKRSLLIESDSQSSQTVQTDILEAETTRRDSTGHIETETDHRQATDETTEVTTKTTEYDTSKPVIPSTGRPPVRRETETITKNVKREQVQQSARQTEDSHVIADVDKLSTDNTETQSSVNTATTVKETKKVKTTGWAWWLLFAAGGVVIWICFKKGLIR